MAAPIAAGILVGAGLFYLSRVGPRIAQRVAMAESQTAKKVFQQTKPYHSMEYGFHKTMTEREAYLLLGFTQSEAGALFNRPSEEEVKKRYRCMMKDLHSDISGTPYLATKINEARDLIIK